MEAIDCACLSRTIDAIYVAVGETARWHEALEMMRGCFRANHVIAIIAPDTVHHAGLSLMLHSTNDGELSGNPKSGHFSEMSNFLQTVRADCPFASIAPREVATLSELMALNEWRQSAFCQAVMKDFGTGAHDQGAVIDMLCIEVALDDGSTYRFRFLRSKGRPPLCEDDRKIAHCRRADGPNRVLMRAVARTELFRRHN